MPNRLLHLGLAVLGLVALPACGPSTTTATTGSGGSGTTAPPSTGEPGRTAPGDGLPGSAWRLGSWASSDGQLVDAAAGVAATLEFGAASRLTGSTGCNSFGGTYTVDGPRLTIALGPMTLRGCADDRLTAQERAITRSLGAVTGYRITGEQLTLSGDAGPLLTYTAAATGLEDTSWKVRGVNNGKGAVVSSVATEQQTLVFAPGGRFSGSGGCNEFFGTYTTTDPTGITVQLMGNSKVGCMPEEREQAESDYRSALGRVATYDIRGDELTLRDDTGATQVTAVRA